MVTASPSLAILCVIGRFACLSWYIADRLLPNWACDRHEFVLGATAGVRCAMICIFQRRYCPGRHSLMFPIYCLGGACLQWPHSYGLPRGRWPSKNASWIKSSTSPVQGSSVTFIPVPGPSVRSARPCHNTRGTDAAFLYLPGTSVSSVRPCHITRRFWKLYHKTYPYPELV